MDRQFLDEYRRLEREHWWFRVRAEILSDIVSSLTKGKPGLSILNVGAATGRSTEILQPFGAVSSVEYDEPSFLYCRDVLGLEIVQASITELPFPDNAFDMVCCFDVVEHVEDDVKSISELVRVCRPGGTIIVTVPAFMSLWSDHDRINHHYRRYLKNSLYALFQPHAGKKLREAYYNALLFPPIWLVRRLERLMPKKQDAELKPDNEFMQSPLTDKLFGTIFSLERHLLKHLSFPFGVSLMLAWQKSDA